MIFTSARVVGHLEKPLIFQLTYIGNSMYNTTQTVDGPHGSKVTGTVTEVTGGQIWEIKSGNDEYERCPYTGRFYPKN